MLEGSIESSDDVALVVRLTQAMLPDMKRRLQQQPSELSAEAIEALAMQADAIAAGNTPDWTELGRRLAGIRCQRCYTVVTLLLKRRLMELQTALEKPAEPTLKELVRKELKDKLAVLAGLMERISRNRNSTASADEIIAIHTIAGTTALDPLGKESEVARALEGFLEVQSKSRKAFSDHAMWTVATSLAHFETCLAVHEGDPEAALAGDEDSLIEQLLALTVEFEAPATVHAEDTADDETPC